MIGVPQNPKAIRIPKTQGPLAARTSHVWRGRHYGHGFRKGPHRSPVALLFAAYGLESFGGTGRALWERDFRLCCAFGHLGLHSGRGFAPRFCCVFACTEPCLAKSVRVHRNSKDSQSFTKPIGATVKLTAKVSVTWSSTGEPHVHLKVFWGLGLVV